MPATFGLAVENFTSAEKTPQIEELLATESEVPEVASPRDIANLRGALELCDVSFRYEAGAPQVGRDGVRDAGSE